MIFSYYGFAVTMVALFVFVGISDAIIPSEINEITEVEKLVTSKKYQDKQEALIMNGLDKDSKAAKATIEAIRKLSLERKVNGTIQGKMDALIGSILTATRLLSTAERMAYMEFETALNLTATDPKAAIEIVRNSIEDITHFVFTAGVEIEDAYGSLLALTGGLNHKEIKQSMNTIQGGGNSFLASLKIAEQLLLKGIEAGGKGAEEGCKAAREAVATGGIAAFEYFNKSAKLALETSLSSSPVAMLKEANQVSGIIESFKTNVSTDNPAALAAIASLKEGLQALFNSRMFITQSTKDASTIMTEALTTTILETADAMTVAEKAIEEAGTLAKTDIEAAVIAVQNGIKLARDEVIRGSTIGFLGFGAARHIAGGISLSGLIPAMVEIIIGRVSAYDDLKLAQETALLGLYAGGAAIDQGTSAALQICEAAGNALYPQFVESARIGLNVFRRNIPVSTGIKL